MKIFSKPLYPLVPFKILKSFKRSASKGLIRRRQGKVLTARKMPYPHKIQKVNNKLGG